MPFAMTIRNRLPSVEVRQRTELSELLLYWRSIYKRKWWILLLALLFAIAAMVSVSFMTPIYRATATLMVEQNRARIVSVEEVYSGVSANREHYQTQMEILRSPALAAKVIDSLKLATHPEFDPRQQKPGLLQTYLSAPSATQKDWTEERLQAVVLNDFLSRVSVEPARFSQIVRVSFDASDPLLAAKIAN